MRDTHCHLLPGIDDGPRSLEDSVALAFALTLDGVTGVLCTPHYSRQFPTDHADARARFGLLRSRLNEASLDLDLELELAAEVSPAFAVDQPLDELQARSIGGRFLLVEVLPDTPLGFFAAADKRLTPVGLKPIFAHPERCRAVQRYPEILDEARANGCLVQVVAPSLLERWGAQAAAVGWFLVETGRADLLGSDSHGHKRRAPHLREVVQLVAERAGVERALALTERGPASLFSQATR
jgi:protein-tyrosine phosphatase